VNQGTRKAPWKKIRHSRNKKPKSRMLVFTCLFVLYIETVMQDAEKQQLNLSNTVRSRTKKNAPESFSARFQKLMWINITP